MLTPVQFIKELDSHTVNYSAVMAHPDFKRVVADSPHDFNLFIPVRKRMKFLRPCVEHIRSAAQKASMKVRVVIVENDDSPNYLDACACHDVDYVFVPSDGKRSLGLFEKSLCYNLGFLCVPRTEWAIYHDLDILVDEDYFIKVRQHLCKNPKWLQPYCKKRVRMLSNWATMLITDGTYDRSQEWLVDNSCPSKPGSPGGSIVVRSSDFVSVGGYDPEMFFGYSPEDSFFWIKLELLHKPIEGVIHGHFLGAGSYADDPPIEVYHMDHPLASGENPRYSWMLELLESFYLYSNAERQKILSSKRDTFVKATGLV